MRLTKRAALIGVMVVLVGACGQAASTPTPVTTAPGGTPAPAGVARRRGVGCGRGRPSPNGTTRAPIRRRPSGRRCSTSAPRPPGITIQRQAVPRDELINKVLLGRPAEAAAQRAADRQSGPAADRRHGCPRPADRLRRRPHRVSTQNLVHAGTYKGKVYGIAPGINGMALFYNKDMFTAAGLKPPTTWAEIRGRCQGAHQERRLRDGLLGPRDRRRQLAVRAVAAGAPAAISPSSTPRRPYSALPVLGQPRQGRLRL